MLLRKKLETVALMDKYLFSICILILTFFMNPLLTKFK